MSKDIRVFPSLGYLNNTFGIFNDQDLELILLRDEKVIKPLPRKADGNQYYYYRPSKPGLYRVQREDGEYCDFEVRDSYILGSSIYKSAYLFDDIPFIFIVKKDRCIIYDINNPTKLDYFEFSPDSLVKYSDSKLLAKIKDDNMISLAELSIPSFRYNQLYSDHLLIYENEKILITEADDVIHVTPLSENFKEYEYRVTGVKQCSFHYGKYLVIEVSDKVIVQNIESPHDELILSKDSSFAVNLKEGYYMLAVQGTVHIHTFSGYHFSFVLPEIYSFNQNLYEQHNNFIFSKGEICHEENYKQRAINYLKSNTSIGLGGEFSFPVDLLVRKEGVIKIVQRGNNCKVILTINEIYLKSISGRKTKQSSFLDSNDILWQFQLNVNKSEQDTILLAAQKEDLEDIVEIYSNKNLVICYDRNKNLTEIFCQNKKVEEIECIEQPTFYNRRHLLAFRNIDGSYQFCTIGRENVFFYASNDHPFNFRYLDQFAKVLSISKNNVYSSMIDINEKKSYDIVDLDNLMGNYAADKAGMFTLSGTKLYGNFLMNDDGLIYSIKDHCVKSSIISNQVLASVSNSHLILTSSDHENYVLFSYNINERVYSRIELVDEKISFDNKDSRLLPGGEKLLLKRKDSGWLQLYNFQTNEYEDFFDGNFVEFSDDGSIVVEDQETNKLILDPYTFARVKPTNYHFYKFKSPDQRFSTALATATRYIILSTGEFISREQYQNIASVFKKHYYEQESRYLDRIKTYGDELRKTYSLPSNHVIQKLDDVVLRYPSIEIIDHRRNTVLEVPVYDLNYYNYAAFSFDNKYLAYVGKPGIHNGGFGIVELEEIEGNIAIKDKLWYSSPGYATWVCGISKLGFFATYSSDTKTYVLDLNKQNTNDSSLKYIGHDYKIGEALNKEVTVFHGRSYLCFNHSGNLMVASQKGYSSIARGGSGHKHSALLFVIDLLDKTKKQMSFSEHAASVVSAGFSADDTKLFSIDADGVIIVRNL
ncbi:hypothetical protein K2F45_06905 [Sphingobacterium siyangense]|uniref:hypothetical protein n=1 Tax=Sphingobacterium siyangense TaxID=459529 RepID=UPI0020109AB8|nr:hypothetical protein [Sphingobacterium siyangense]UQA76716.1 hypothetical protein K2F45_06905 [Sphingobacterium siyangense]